MSVRSEALRLHSLGYDPIPLAPGEKRPLRSAWQRDVDLPPEAVTALFDRDDVGLGIATGRGLLVIDTDFKPDQGVNGEADLAALSGVEPLPPTVRARTASGGFHRYYRLPAGVKLGNTVGKVAPGIDTRCEGGQVVAPPTVLADGRSYRWLDQSAPCATYAPAQLPPRWVALLQRLDAAGTTDAGPAPTPPAGPMGGEALVTAAQREHGLRRARAYLASMPPAIAGQGGHNKAMDAACRTVERVYSQEDALTALGEWNARCVPPWTDAELRHKVRSAELKYAYGSANDDQGEENPPSGGGDSATPPAPRTDDDRDDVGPDPVLDEAIATFKKDHEGQGPEEVFPGEDPIDVLKRELRTQRGPGRPTTYLPKDFQPLDFHGMRPSRFAHDEHTSRPWRKRLDDGSWTGGATEGSLTHELEEAGLNKRSAALFRQRVRHVADTIHVYDAPGQVFVERNGATYLNVYRPSTLQPEAGDWAPLRSILLNLHDGNAEYLEWTLDWCATVIRDIRAGRPQLPGVAVVFYGAAQGAGKGVFGEVMRALVGEHNFVTIRQSDLDETFNGWAEGKLFVVANEVFSSENRTQSESNKLKPYISDPTVAIRRMYAEVTPRPNVAAWLFFSNDMRPVALERLDRRFTVFKTGGRIDPLLGAQVADDAHAGGPIVRAFLHELLTRPITRFRRMTPLVTTAKSEVQYDTASSADKFLAELLHGDGFDGLTDAYRSERGSNDLYAEVAGTRAVERRVFYEVYRCWARANGYNALGSAQLYRLARNAGLVEERHRWGERHPWFFMGLPGLPGDPPRSLDEHPNIAAARAVLEVP